MGLNSLTYSLVPFGQHRAREESGLSQGCSRSHSKDFQPEPQLNSTLRVMLDCKAFFVPYISPRTFRIRLVICWAAPDAVDQVMFLYDSKLVFQRGSWKPFQLLRAVAKARTEKATRQDVVLTTSALSTTTALRPKWMQIPREHQKRGWPLIGTILSTNSKTTTPTLLVWLNLW